MPQIKKKVPEKNINKENSLFKFALLIAFAIFICLFTTYKVAGDDDVFWHLATGKYIIQNFQIPSTDVFGYMTSGQKWIPFEWGWDTLTYSLYNIGGFYTLSILRTLIILSIFVIILFYLQKQKVSDNLIILFSVLLFFGILTRLSIRPQLVSYLFFTLLVYLFSKYKSSDSIKISIFYILPVIFLIWANMHMGVVLGVLVFGVYIVSELIDYFKQNKKSAESKKKVKYILVAFGLSLVAMLLNPHFIETYIYTFQHSQMDMLEQINEWKSPFSSAVSSFYNVRIYFFFLIAGLVTVYYSAKSKNYFPILIYIVLGIYSLQAMRFISDYMLIVFIPFMIGLSFVLKNEKIVKAVNSVFLKMLLVLGLIFLIYSASDDSFYKKYLGNYFRETGFGENDNFFPKEMFDFMRAENIDKLGSRPYNNLKIGGYFIWNFYGSKNFIDSRNLNDSIYSIYKNIDLKRPGFESQIDNIDIDYFIYSTPFLTLNAREIERNIISYLSKASDKWILVYWDDKSFLFVRNVPKFQNLISKYEYKFISPYNFIFEREALKKSYNTNRNLINSELSRKLSSEPNGKIIKSMTEYFRRIN